MRIDFGGRRVLITGSTSGIGLAAAKAFRDAGAFVVINGRSGAGVDAALARLTADPPRTADAERIEPTGFAGDLGEPATFERLTTEHPYFDIVINNIGTYEPNDFFDITDDDWMRLFQRNVMSGIRTARSYLPQMVERGWGRVIYVSSESAINIPVDMIHYGVTKTAQLAISRGLAKRVAGTGVTVNAVLAGPTMTEGVVTMLTGGEHRTDDVIEDLERDFVATHRSSSLIQRMATADEVAAMIVYASSDYASATTGSALRVDGGVIESIL